MKRALRELLSFGLPLITILLLSTEGQAQCPVVIDSIVTTDVTCSGANDGQICIYVSGGFPDYTYQLFNGPLVLSSGQQTATSYCFTGLGSGVTNYQVIVVGEDGSGGSCQAAITFTVINDPPPFSITVSTTNDSCPDGNVGTAVVDVTGGVGPYTYSWLPFPGSTDSIFGLNGGSYSVEVSDANGCSQSEPFTITSPADWSGTLTPDNPICFGGTDGQITSSGITGGTPPYTFSWTGTAQTTEDITGLAAGPYTLTVTDAIGCTHTFPTVVIVEPTEISITETHQDVSCNGLVDGSINISVSGGAGGYTYLWSPGGGTSQDTSGLAPGTYTVVVTDAAGCQNSLAVDILNPVVLVLNPASTDASCGGLCDGSVSVSPTGGTLPYTFSWSPNITNGPSSVSVCAGTYDVVVTDNNGCQETASFTITDNQLQLSVVSTDISCNGSCDGTATATVTGNNSPFTYDWQPAGGNASSASNLCAGNYTLTVTDGTGCSVVENFTIVDADPIVISLAVTDVSCEGGSDGAIDLTVSGGVGPYTYQWYPLGQTTEDINGLPAGDYSVVVTDANGCTSSAVTLGGAFTGGTLALPDGTGATYNTTIAITGFPSTGTLTDINDFQGVCLTMEHSWLSDLDIELSCPNGQTVLLEGSFPTGQTGASVFLGDANDNDNVTPVNGVGFQYCWTNTPTYGTMEFEAGIGNTVTVSQGQALPAGVYSSVDPLSGLLGCPLNGDWTITITDNFAIDNGFIFDWNIGLSGGGSNDSLATVNEPGPITINSNVTEANCGSCDGAVTITPVGGAAPYTYLWNTGATTATITNLCAGVYNVIVTDANGCTANFFVPVDHIDGPTGANTVIVDASCFGSCDGEATVTGIGGTAPYTYQWVPGGYNTSNVTGLCAGTYFVQIQDALNCIYTEPVTIGEPAEILIGQTVINSICGQCNGQIQLTPISGVAPFTYSWSPSVGTGTNATALCAGVYNITVTDGTGCSEVVTSLVNDIPSATITMTGTDPLCNDSCNGQVIATPTGGTAPFSYLWDDPSNQTDSIATGLCEGLYTVTLTDANGCVAVNQLSLVQPAPIGLSILIIDNGTCAGNCDGAITVIPSGGTIPFTYLWDDPSTQTTATASNLCAGIYTVEVTDANGCTDITTGTVNNPVGFTASAVGTDASCNGTCDGEATVSIVGGTAPFSYLWDDPSGQTTATAVGLCAGSYTVTVTDANNCDFIAPVTIAEPDPIIITFSGIVDLQCDGICIGEATADVTGGTGPYTYLWDDALAQTTATATGLCASTYTVTVTDANGCVASQSVTISGPNGLSSSVTSSTNALCFSQCNGSATVTPTGGTAPYTYQWNDPSNQTTATATGLCAGTYSVVVTDANGCISTSTVIITEPQLLVANTTANDVSCFGECDGTTSVFVTGGTPPYTYQWNDPNNQTTVTATGLCAGTYTISVTGSNGCVATATETIFQPPTPVAIDTVVTDATCGVCNGEIEVIPNGGVPPYTVLWGDGQTTTTVTGLCPGIHTVDVTDATGCTQNFDIAVSNTSGPTGATVASTDASCFGVCDGEAAVTPIGGVPPYTYLWVPGGQTTSSVTGLCAGSYNVQISDSLGCIYTQLVIINEPPQINGNANTTQATCGQCNGEIALSTTGGDGGPYTYVWSPNVSVNETASALCAGIYAVTITDGSGCETVETIPVSNIDGPVVTVSSTDATCDGTCDGTASVLINGGTAPFTILWDDPSAQTNALATGLCAGTYNVTVTDANGCQSTQQVVIDAPDPISLSLQLVTDATCPGACDGTGTIIASGGTLPYTYSWSPSGGTASTATGLCAGSYTVIVTDANGCTATETVVVDEPPVIVINTNTLDPTCSGLCDGEAYADATGGSGGFTYQWNDLANTTNDTVVGLCAGTYTVVVTDLAGCTESTDVTINDPAPITVTITPESVTCFGNCDGSAVAVAVGGNAPYTYQWNDPASTVNDTVTGLCAGIYGLVVTDSLGCTTTSSTVITEPFPLTLLDSVQNITCGGSCDGIAGVLVQGGTGPYDYQWNDPSNQTTPLIFGLCAGTYQVVVTDANGCSDSTSVTIIEPAELDAQVSVQNPTCGGVCDGEATVTPIGGTGPFTVLWLPGLESTNTITGLCAGSYTVIVVDASGCSDTTTINLTEPPVLTADITSTTQVLCASGCIGEATVTAAGGTPPFTYAWNTSPVQTTSTATGLCVGIWAVTVTDDIGCSANAVAVISDSAALTATIPISTQVTCNGACDGTATVFANGGVGPYSYSWDDPNFQSTQTITGLCPGVYTVTVTDSQSPACTTQATVIIVEPLTLTLTATATDVSCGTDCDGVGTAIPLGGTPPYVVTWNDPSGLGTNLCVGTYTATVTDANGCTALASATVNGLPAIVSNATSVASSCSNIADGSINLTVVGGVPGYSFDWSPGGANTEDLNNVIFGAYTVVITDATGCSITATYSVGTLVNINADAGPDDTVCVATPIVLNGFGGGTYLWSPSTTLSDPTISDPTATPSDTTTYYLTVSIGACTDVDSVTIYTYGIPPVDGGNDVQIPTGGSIGLNANGVVTGWTYSWEPADFLDNPDITNPTASPDETTMFYVTVVDANGCSSTDSVLVEVLPGIVFPDGISPNGDGINDTWIIDNIELFQDAIVEVYNRWGQQLFQSAPGYPIPWDGRFKGKDLPVGTYYYVIHSVNFAEPFTGPITIIR
ncbi:MAG: gliding motility-associated C-terminal domain-containing protein [Flavobacteriales bacterium]|nr:gliding motility-associated C-terminal domain-containing protein [Flavobacteriales bacterium]